LSKGPSLAGQLETTTCVTDACVTDACVSVTGVTTGTCVGSVGIVFCTGLSAMAEVCAGT